MSLDDQLERAQADGRMSAGDADEVRHFADFLTALGAAGVPSRGAGRTPEQAAAFSRIYAEHYPEDYARAVAEHLARTRTCEITVDDRTPVAVTSAELARLEQLAIDDPPAAVALGREWRQDQSRLRYGPATTSPASPGGPEHEGGPDV